MRRLYRFEVGSHASLDEAWEELEQRGIEVIYSSEEGEIKEIFGYWDEGAPIPHIASIQSSTSTELPSIDWQDQWALHGLNFQDGYVHVDLSQFGSHQGILRLSPGPGFGDLSHPTTRMMLRLMEKYVHYHIVVDIGCGSGILAIAAVALGAPEVYGLDISPEALEHSHLNATLNQLETLCHFLLPNDFLFTSTQPIVIVMNMIMSEQKEAWESIPQLHDKLGVRLASGIRKEEREAYLKMTAQWGWQLKEEIEEEDWLGFAFIF